MVAGNCTMSADEIAPYYLTDAGAPAIIVLDVATGEARRVLEGHASTTARTDRDIVLGGRTVMAPSGKPLHVNVFHQGRSEVLPPVQIFKLTTR